MGSVFRLKYRINARVAFRLAHGWSQRQAAEEWNRLWPDEPKTLKSFSYWEVWPSSTGHEPSLEVLDRLAHLYQCSVADLVIDLADYSHFDAAAGAETTALPLCRPEAEPAPSESSVWVTATGLDSPDNFAMLLMKNPASLSPSDMEKLATASRVTQQRLGRLLAVPILLQPGPTSSRSSLPLVIPSSQEEAIENLVNSDIPMLRRLIDVYDLPEDGPVRPLSELHQDTKGLIAWRLNSDYTRILAKLPELLPELTRALTLLKGAEHIQIARHLVQVYRAADAVADKFGYYDLSAQIIGVMRWAAKQAGDPLSEAVTSYVRGETFFADSQLAAGRRMLERAADQLSPGSSEAASAIYGSLHMRAAVAAARAGLPALAWNHLSEAQAMASQVTEGVFLGTAFGLGSVRIHEVTLALDLQEPETALAAAAGWSPPESMSAERRSHFYVDIAQAQLLMGRYEAVVDALHTARAIAPEHICAHPQVRDILTMLVHSGKLTADAARNFLVTAQTASDARC